MHDHMSEPELNRINQAVDKVCQANKILLDGPIHNAMINSIRLREASKKDIQGLPNTSYDQVMYNFQRLLKNNAAAQTELTQLLNEATNKSAKAIDLRAENIHLNNDKAYHKKPHPFELVSDSKRKLNSTSFKDTLLCNLTELAAACHDIVQEDSTKVENENKSNVKFVEYASKALDIFIENLKRNSVQTVHKKLIAAAELLKTQLSFIGHEIIVNGTFLVISSDFKERKPLLYYVTLVDQALHTAESQSNYTSSLPTQHRNLYAAATIVSLYDTSRTIDPAVGQTQIMNQLVNHLPSANQKSLANLFERLHIKNDIDKELFFARFTQNLRMFPETNKFIPASSEKKLSPTEMDHFIVLFNSSYREHASPDEFIADCEKFNMVQIFNKFIARLPGEAEFAQSLNFADHETLAVAYGESHAFRDLDAKGWGNYAKLMPVIQEWYSALSADETKAIGETFILLASLGQHGLVHGREHDHSIAHQPAHPEFDEIRIIEPTEERSFEAALVSAPSVSKL